MCYCFFYLTKKLENKSTQEHIQSTCMGGKCISITEANLFAGLLENAKDL